MNYEKRKNYFNRRSETDRRKAYRLGYFINGGVERRGVKDRRSYTERRKDLEWVEGCYSIAHSG